MYNVSGGFININVGELKKVDDTINMPGLYKFLISHNKPILLSDVVATGSTNTGVSLKLFGCGVGNYVWSVDHSIFIHLYLYYSALAVAGGTTTKGVTIMYRIDPDDTITRTT